MRNGQGPAGVERMARRNDGISTSLALLPWWVSVLTAGVVYVALAHVAPAITTTNPLLQGLLNAAPGLAPLFGIILLIRRRSRRSTPGAESADFR